jgi:hypothetical protein
MRRIVATAALIAPLFVAACTRQAAEASIEATHDTTSEVSLEELRRATERWREGTYRHRVPCVSRQSTWACRRSWAAWGSTTCGRTCWESPRSIRA